MSSYNKNTDVVKAKTIALMYASKNGALETVKLLLEKGTDIDAKDNKGKTALMYAAEKGEFETVKFLLEKGANLIIGDNKAKTALTYAYNNGQTKIIEFLLEKVTKENKKINENDNENILHYALENGHLEIIKLFLDNEEYMNIESTEKETPLITAVISGQLESVKLLLDNKADIEVKDHAKRTALFYSVLSYLKAIGESDKTLPSKSKLKNYLDIANLLVAKGADILITDKFSLTLLMLSSQLKEFNEISKNIIEKADMNYINKKGFGKETTLILAVRASNLEIVKLLTEKGADIYAIDSAEKNALIYSVEKDNIEIIKYFIEEKNIDIEQKYRNGILLDYALVYGNIEIIKYLLSKGGKLHYEDNTVTSLMLVSASTKADTVKYIIDYTKENLKLDIKDYINYKNENGQTALIYAEFNAINMDKKESDRKDVVNLLKSYGAQ